jgi:hypothetical protein
MANELEKFINNNRESFDKERPDPAVLSRVLEQMQAKGKKEPKGIVISFRVLRMAAASIILLASGVTFWLALNKPETKAPAVVKVSPVLQPIKSPGTAPVVTKVEVAKSDIADLVDQDMARRKRLLRAKMEKQVVLASLNDMDSPASRIIATARIQTLKNTGDDVVDALVQTLNTDPNTNVRLAALDGLARFYRENNVRKKLVQSMKKQDDPMVQIALIRLLTQVRASGILTELEQLAGNESNMKAVRDCAYSNILRLKSS